MIMHAPLLAEDSRAFAYNRLQASIEVVARREKSTSDMCKHLQHSQFRNLHK